MAHILLIEDDDAVCSVLARWLEEAGYDYRVAGSVPEARRWLDRESFEVIVTDIGLPGESGLVLIDEIQQRAPETQIVVLTGREDAQTAIEALTGGARAYLIKPLEMQQLLGQIRRSLDCRNRLLQRRHYTQGLEHRVRHQTEHLRRAHEETIHRLVSASLMRDEETGAHIKRTGLFSEVLARAAGWKEAEIDAIRLAAPMHDVGKIGIPDGILRKPGPLTPHEFEIMKTHTEIGARMLAGSDWPVLIMAHDIALCHHERWDGFGYPRGLGGEEIPACARIVNIVDAYDALTHDRVYRKAFPEAEALQIMHQQRGRQFDPLLYDLFRSVLPELREIASLHPDEAAAAAHFAQHRSSGVDVATLEAR